jgi:hypothetical protein
VPALAVWHSAMYGPRNGPGGVPTGSICARAAADKTSRTPSKTSKTLSKSGRRT